MASLTSGSQHKPGPQTLIAIRCVSSPHFSQPAASLISRQCFALPCNEVRIFPAQSNMPLLPDPTTRPIPSAAIGGESQPINFQSPHFSLAIGGFSSSQGKATYPGPCLSTNLRFGVSHAPHAVHTLREPPHKLVRTAFISAFRRGLGGGDCPKSPLDFWMAKLEGSLCPLLYLITKRAEDFIEPLCESTVTN